METVRMLKFVDMHCHVHFPVLLSRLDTMLSDACSNGVEKMVCNGCESSDWSNVLDLSRRNPQIIPSIGIHPWKVGDHDISATETLRKLLVDNTSCAVGETGLDHSTRGRHVSKERQVEFLRRHLDIAKELRRPVTVHCVQAYGSLLSVCQTYKSFPEGLILHSFMGSADIVPAFVKLGAYFSFSGAILNQAHTKARNALAAVPVDRLLLETDSPDQFPSSIKDDIPSDQLSINEDGQVINEPKYISHIASAIASIRNESVEHVFGHTYENSMRLLDPLL